MQAFVLSTNIKIKAERKKSSKMEASLLCVLFMKIATLALQ